MDDKKAFDTLQPGQVVADPDPVRPKSDPEDRDWLAYLGKLPPDDSSGAFLLGAELPNQDSSPRQVLAGLLLASRRAFGPGTPLEFTDFTLGRIWGEMRILLPQGREIRERFSGEQGWKAVAILGKEYEARPVTAYYRQRCMNPVRVIGRSEAIVDTSDITFVPHDRDRPEPILSSFGLDALFLDNMQRLQSQYESVRGSRQAGLLRQVLRALFGAGG